MASVCRHFLSLIIFLPRFFPSFILARHLLSQDSNQPILVPANELRKISSYSGFIAVPSHNLVSPYIHITWRVLYFTLILLVLALSASGDKLYEFCVRVQNSLNYSTGNWIRTHDFLWDNVRGFDIFSSYGGKYTYYTIHYKLYIIG